MYKLAPSLLAADFGILKQQLEELESGCSVYSFGYYGRCIRAEFIIRIICCTVYSQIYENGI